MDLSTREGRRELGARLRRAAREANLSLEDLATRIGCSRALIYQYVSGSSLAQPDRLQQIGRELGRPLAWFFADEEEASPAASSPQPPNVPPEAAGEDGRRLRERLAQLRSLVYAYAGPPDWRGVVDTCQQMLPLLEHEDDQGRIAEVLLMQGEALIQRQELGPAREKLEQAGTLFRSLGRTDRALACLQSLGHINVTLGRTEEALAQFRQVAEGEWWAQRWQGTLSLGAAYEVLGRYPDAAEMFLRAQEIADAGDDPAQADTARLYIEANWANLDLDWGDDAGAAERAERCVLRAQRLGLQDQYVEALLTRGLALLGRFELSAALTELSRALSVSQLTRDDPRWSLALAGRSLVRTACRQTADAVADGKEALALALRGGAARAEMLAQRALAEAYLAAGNTSEARYHIDRASAITLSLRQPLAQAQFAALRARLESADGDVGAATTARAALTMADSLGARTVQRDARLTLARLALVGGNWEDAITEASAAEALSTPPAWQALAVIADARAASGDEAGARAAFATALVRLAESRGRVGRAGGVDALLEDPDAETLWRRWLDFLRARGEAAAASAQAREADWPPLLNWLEEHPSDVVTADALGHSDEG